MKRTWILLIWESVIICAKAVLMSDQMSFNPVIILNQLLLEQLDSFQVLAECAKLRIKIDSSVDLSTQKYSLQKGLIEEILKNENLPNKDYYENLLESTRKLLNLKSLKITGIACSFVGCFYKGKRHRNYINHMKEIHPNQTSYRCEYKRHCKRNFASIEQLENHVKTEHIEPNHPSNQRMITPSLRVICKCGMISCGQKRFNSIKDLMGHVNNDHSQEPRICIFEHCAQIFKAGSVSRHHFRIKHLQKSLIILKKEYRLPNVTSILPNDELFVDQPLVGQGSVENELGGESNENSSVEDQSDMEDSSDSESFSDKDHDKSDLFFMMAYCDFLNRLTNIKYIPASSVKCIASEYISIAKKSAAQKEKVLRSSLKQCPNLGPEEIEAIISDVSGNDQFLKAQQELLSEHKRSQFLAKHFKLVQPKEILLNPEEVKRGGSKDCIHYVPIRESLKVLVEDTSFIDVMERQRNEGIDKKGSIEDIKDGAAYTNNAFFSDNPGSLALMLYSDAVELTNPLGSGRLKHKIVQVFWTICDLPKRHRSQIDKLQLGLVFKEKLLKKYSLAHIFKLFVEDLHLLEDSGIIVNKPVTRTLKAGVIAYSADNLEVIVESSILIVLMHIDSYNANTNSIQKQKS